jgi:hypothetical protein
VIAVFAEADRAQAATMEPLLGPNDELLPVQDCSFPALMNAGTARAHTVAGDDRRTLHCAARLSR